VIGPSSVWAGGFELPDSRLDAGVVPFNLPVSPGMRSEHMSLRRADACKVLLECSLKLFAPITTHNGWSAKATCDFAVKPRRDCMARAISNGTNFHPLTECAYAYDRMDFSPRPWW
jgi:hypothetical protein